MYLSVKSTYLGWWTIIDLKLVLVNGREKEIETSEELARRS